MFLHYLPDELGLNPPAFARSRADVFGASPAVTTCAATGPDGGRGVVCCVVPSHRAGHEPRVGHYPAEQHWEKTPGGWWIGWSRTARPTPDLLSRAEAYPGHRVTLEDGSEWLVPVGRLWDGSDPFPKKLRLDPETGAWAETPHEKFRQITERAGELFADFMVAAISEDESGNPTATLNVDADLAVDALSLNYHVGAEEISALGLLTSENIGHIAKAFVDFPTWKLLLETRDEAKKKRPGVTPSLSDTDSGAPGCSPATGRAGPTCGPQPAGSN